MLAEHVIHLSQTYRHLGRAWNQDELAARYAAANRRGEQSRTGTPDTVPERPIALLATAIPSAATLSVAIHLLHALPDSVPDKLRATSRHRRDQRGRCPSALPPGARARRRRARRHRRRVAARHLRHRGPAARVLAGGPGATVDSAGDPEGGALALKLDRLPRRGLSRAPGGPRRHGRSPPRRVRVRRLRPLALPVAGLCRSAVYARLRTSRRLRG
jgi:hypothetical protein